MNAKRPIPLWIGIWLGLVVTLVFLNAYKLMGDTTTRGWLATFAAAFELWGVVLVASPELRPIVERAAARSATALRHLCRSIGARLWRLLRLPGRSQTVSLGSAVDVSSALALDVKRGYSAPGPNATTEEKVAFLLEEVKRILGLVEGLENQLRDELGGVRTELAQATADLREHTAMAVREVAEAELRMRLLGVGFVMTGIALAYAASVA
jgi:hypothetical protein